MKITIDVDAVVESLQQFSNMKDEWYGRENKMTACCFIDVLGNIEGCEEFLTVLRDTLKYEGIL